MHVGAQHVSLEEVAADLDRLPRQRCSENHQRVLRLTQVELEDPYASASRKRNMNDLVAELSALSVCYVNSRPEGSERSHHLDLDNPGTARFLDAQANPGLRKWRSQHVPTAGALVPCQRPDQRRLVDGTALLDHESDIFRYVDDAIGVRTRAALMGGLLWQHAHQAEQKDLNWLSLACGAAIPVVDAAAGLSRRRVHVRLTLVDHDRAALRLASRIAAEQHISTCVHRMNVLARQGLTRHLGHQGYDVIDILGLFEYLKDQDWTYRYQKVMVSSHRPMAGAVTLLRNAWELLRPGGLLVFGNMLPTHPQLDFTLHVVQWPHIRPRAPQQIQSAAAQAGLPVDRLRGYRAPDGVYGVYALRK